MDILNLMSKAYWHLFKVMPCEMILKKKWDAYRKIESHFYGHDFDLACVKGGNESVVNNKTIWFYWNTEIENAPKIVNACLHALKLHVPDGWRLVVLSEESAKDYVQLPTFIEELKSSGKMWYALYADLIRLALLYKYGGIWCDATCYLTQSVPLSVLDAPLFMFSYDGLLNVSPAKFENWFIKADKGNYVIERILQDLLYYWSQPKKEQEYFVWFHLQTALYNKDIIARELMDKIPYYYNYDAMLVLEHYGLTYEFTEDLWLQIVHKCFVQKLTYKFDAVCCHSDRSTLLKHILNE